MGQIGAETPPGWTDFPASDSCANAARKNACYDKANKRRIYSGAQMQIHLNPKVDTGLPSMLLEARPPPRFGVRVEA